MKKKYEEQHHIEIKCGGVIIEIEGNFVITKRENGKVVTLPVQIQQKKVPHFFKMTFEKRKKVKRWLKNQWKELSQKTRKEKEFLKKIKEGTKYIKYEYMISTIEPTMNQKNKKIEFIKGAKVARGYTCEQWEKFAKEFMPERGSRLANLYELFIWYAWRIVKGHWSLGYVANDSSGDGNYIDSPNSSGEYETSAKRKVGGFRDGIGNTFKIVTHGVWCALVGGNCSRMGCHFTISNVDENSKDSTIYNGTGVIVLTK